MEIYGKCYVKVQFDKNKMPYAFVQFEVRRTGLGYPCLWPLLMKGQNEEEARVCLTNAKGLVIDGRPIRVEHARAQRKYSRRRPLFSRIKFPIRALLPASIPSF